MLDCLQGGFYMKNLSILLFAAVAFMACSCDCEKCDDASNVAGGCDKCDGTSAIVGDTFTDARDGNKYKVVTIGLQTWMAENLNYKVDNSYCYNDDPANCKKYGRLYTWAASRGKSESECGPGRRCGSIGKLRGICPQGWHLPSGEEFEILLNSGEDGWDFENHFEYLMSTTGGWVGCGTQDIVGFSALPAGHYSYDAETKKGHYVDEGHYTGFWLSNDGRDEADFSFSFLRLECNQRVEFSDEEYDRLSVRCVLD